MKCFECGKKMVVDRTRKVVAYTMGGLPQVMLRDVEVRRCPNGHEETVVPRMSDLHAAIASALVRKPAPLAPAEIRFLRKRLGYSQADFAKRMGVASESVSRWETGSVPMKATAEHLLRLMVVFEAPIPNYSTETLAKVTGRPEPAALRFTHTDAWRAA